MWMRTRKNKPQVVTLKADQALIEAMQGVENRSEFIRSAILAALDGTCPVCMGTGILTPRQKEHWQAFERSHAVEECPDCHEMHLTCSHDAARTVSGQPRGASKAGRRC